MANILRKSGFTMKKLGVTTKNRMFDGNTMAFKHEKHGLTMENR